MLYGLILGVIVGLGIEPLLHFLWGILWVWIFPQAWGGIMGGAESSIIRAIVILIALVIAGLMLHKREEKMKKQQIEAENKRHTELIKAINKANANQTKIILKALQQIGGQNGEQSGTDTD